MCLLYHSQRILFSLKLEDYMYDSPKQPDNAELAKAIYFVTEKLVTRGYLHIPDDIEFARPGHKSVFPCGKAYGPVPLDLNQLKWVANNGKFWFDWYEGSYLKLHLHKGMIDRKLEFDPAKQSLWGFVYFTLEEFK
jgi:hypothetical protein